MSQPAPLRARHPIVLLHGALGFVGPPRLEYFRGVRRRLQCNGNCVHAWKVPNLRASVEDRARVLLQRLREHEREGPFHLIAHSMGGLDARCLISSLGGADLVASLTTIATPHHGTEAAEWRNRVLGAFGLLRPGSRLHGFVTQLEIFTHEWSRRFDDANPDVPQVRYRCWGGAVGLWSVAPLFLPLHRMMTRAEGPHDGVVSVRSAALRPELYAGTVPADHFAQLGWKLGLNRLDGFDHLTLYENIVHELVEAGM